MGEKPRYVSLDSTLEAVNALPTTIGDGWVSGVMIRSELVRLEDVLAAIENLPTLRIGAPDEAER